VPIGGLRLVSVAAVVIAGCTDPGTPGSPAQPTDDLPKGEPAGIFGEWLEIDGLPAYRYTLDQRTDSRASYHVTPDEDSTLNWHQLGNDDTIAVATNDGSVQLFDFSHGPRWMNYGAPDDGRYSGGFGYVRDGNQAYSTLFADSAVTAHTRRVFGVGYFDTRHDRAGLDVRRRVTLPFGRNSWLLSRVRLKNDTDRPKTVTHFEYWDVNPLWLAFNKKLPERKEASSTLAYEVQVSDSALVASEHTTDASAAYRDQTPPLVPPSQGPRVFLKALGDTPVTGFDVDPAAFFGSGGRALPDAVAAGAATGSSASDRPCFVLESRIDLPPGDERTLYYAYGYGYGAVPELPDDPATVEQASDEAWREWLPKVTLDDHPAVGRELAWHAYYLRSSSMYDEFFDRRTFPQGFWYLYESGFNASLRDTAQHMLPLVYLEPDMAKDALVHVLGQGDPDGSFPYSIHGYGIRDNVIWDPTDHAPFLLMAVTEYVFGTGDFAFLDEAVRYYPPRSGPEAPVWDHVLASFRHLRDRVGVGQTGLIRVGKGDWNDGIVYMAADDVNAFVEKAESPLNTAQTIVAASRLSAIARRRGDDAVTAEIDAFVASLRTALRKVWTGRWLARAVKPDGTLFGVDHLFLEPQPWGILSGVLDAQETDTLIDAIDELLRSDSPLGAKLHSRTSADPPFPSGLFTPGEGVDGGIWFSLNHQFVWAARERRPALAWDEFLRGTLARHTETYPEVWIGIWSGPDAYNSPLSARPGWTWDIAATGAFGQRWPVQNVHAHAAPLMSFLRLAGLGSDPDGLTIAPALPDERFSIESEHFALAYTTDRVSARHPARSDSTRVRVRLPRALEGQTPALTSSAVRADVRIDGTDAVVDLSGPNAREWVWQIQPR
jgi:hypothetical protein